MDIVEYKKRIVQERIILLTCVQEHFNELCKYLESDLLLEEELYLWNEVALKVNEVAGKKYSYLQLKRNVQRILKNKESFRSVKNVSLQKSVSLTVEQQLSFSCSPLDSGEITRNKIYKIDCLTNLLNNFSQIKRLKLFVTIFYHMIHI